MRLVSRLVPSSLLVVVLLALVAGAAFAQICPPPPTGGNRLVATGPTATTTTTTRTISSLGWFASLLPGQRTSVMFRLPVRPAIAPATVVTKRTVK